MWYLLSRDEQDLVLGLLQALFGTRNLDVVAGVFWPRNLDLGGGLQLQFLQLLPVLADDEAVVFFRDRHGGSGL